MEVMENKVLVSNILKRLTIPELSKMKQVSN